MTKSPFLTLAFALYVVMFVPQKGRMFVMRNFARHLEDRHCQSRPDITQYAILALTGNGNAVFTIGEHTPISLSLAMLKL